MPSRPALHFGHSTSPHQSSNAVNEVVSAIQRKLSINHVEHSASPKSSSPASRRSSFSMDNILHPNKKDKRSDSPGPDHGKKDKKSTIPLRGGPANAKSKDRAAARSPHLTPMSSGQFSMIIESPPLVFFGSPNNSTGALLSGRLKLNIEDPSGQVTLKKFTMILRLAINTKKTIGKDCFECKERYEELNTWNFLTEPKTFMKEKDNQFPFSYLLKGGLPASTNSILGGLKYQLRVKGTMTNGESIDMIHPLVVQRAIAPGPDKSSIRIFPPTNLTGRVILPPVVHPVGTFPVQLTLSGVVEKKKDTQTRWRLRKMMWRVEEHTTMISVPCKKHSAKVGDGKAVQHVESKTIANSEMKTGWKTDFDTIGGEIYLEFDAAVNTKAGHRAVCDVQSEAGLEVKHTMIVELIVAEEYCPNKNTNIITPTGAARILRMQFNLLVTERAGMGISWDEEMPPMYEDVPDSPPGYGSSDRNDGAFGGAIMEDYNGPELEYTELERLVSNNPNDPPTYRELDSVNVNAGLPMRSADQAESSSAAQHHHQYQFVADDVHRPRAAPLLTEDDFGYEPPQYALRQRTPSDSSQVEEDYGEGETSHGRPQN